MKRFLSTSVALALWQLALPSVRAQSVDYLSDIKPLLRERCFACHGALNQEANLRLDTAAGIAQGGDSGPAVTPDTPDASLLIERISDRESDARMPPEHEGEPLTASQVALIRDWVAAGAKGPDEEQPELDPHDHWAFQPVRRPDVPQSDAAWGRNPIDAFLNAQHRQRGLTPAVEASRIVLLRRLSIDLIGVPPTAAEIAACKQDPSPQWYQNTVDRLLADPRHGQRWARHWMDIWRYSDWWGLGEQLRGSQKHIWHWRDWIVDSLNDDLPYDQLLRMMLAADELHPNDLDKLRASGYLARNFNLFNRPQWMDETVEHVSKGMLGLTMNCARCHDHKYDPIEQTDYYRLRAFFEPYQVRMDMLPGTSDLETDGLPRAFDGLLDAPTYRYFRGDENNPDQSSVIAPGVPKILAFMDLSIQPVELPLEAWQPQRRPWVLAAYLRDAAAKLDRVKVAEYADDAIRAAEIELAQAELRAVESRAAATRAEWIQDNESERQMTHHAAVSSVRAVALAAARLEVCKAELALQQATEENKESTAAALQTAREKWAQATVAAEAEVQPTDTFPPLVGAQWTPTRFQFSGSDDPAIEFPASSTGRRSALADWITDRRNPLTARVAVNHLWSRHLGQPLVPTVFDFGRNGVPPHHPQLVDWLAAELIESGWNMKHLHRLICTSQAYRMSSSLADAEPNLAIDPENHWWWRREPIRIESQVVRDSLLAIADELDFRFDGPPIIAADQATSRRRSLYFYHSNNDRNQFLTAFDEALVKDCYRRQQSIVPQQALALANSELAFDTAATVARRLATDDDRTFIEQAFVLLLGIDAGESEIAACQNALLQWQGEPQRARANLIWALINHNDFVTIR